MSKSFRLVLLLLVLIFLGGCARKIPHMLVHDYANQGARLIAVLPVQNMESDDGTASLLRVKLIEELHFKGYPEIPPKWIDERLNAITAGVGNGDPSPELLGKMLNVDAVLYTTLKEGRTTVTLLSSRIAMEAEFELKSTRTGESLWRVHHRAVQRHYGLSRKSLELKSCQFYEPAIQEVLNRALETLPDGPDASGS
jgi:hypothetical protein